MTLAAAKVDDQQLLGIVIGFAALTGLIYVLLRWAAAPALVHAAVGVEYGVNIVATALLMPEYICTRLARKASGHPVPFAYAYGDAVCGAACAVHRCAGLLLTAFHSAALRIGHRQALAIGVASAAASVWALQ